MQQHNMHPALADSNTSRCEAVRASVAQAGNIACYAARAIPKLHPVPSSMMPLSWHIPWRSEEHLASGVLMGTQSEQVLQRKLDSDDHA